MGNHENAREWLRRARSSLAQAEAGMGDADILLEDRCFQAQQSVEKSFKAVCCQYGIQFPKTHDIGRLIDLIESAGVGFPEDLREVRILTDYE